MLSDRVKDQYDFLAEGLFNELTAVRAALYRDPVFPSAEEERERIVSAIACFMRKEFPSAKPARRRPISKQSAARAERPPHPRDHGRESDLRD